VTIGWGIIGCGSVCETKSGPAFQKAHGSRVVAVMRRDGARAEDFARRHGVARWYADARALVSDPEVDAVYVATPPGSHLDLAELAAAEGKPAYVEKPMARCHAECERMLGAFARSGTPLFVAYYRRALPRFLGAKELIDGGALGAIESIRYEYARVHENVAELPWRLQAEHSGGGLLLDLGSHALDLIDFLLGPLENVQGTADNRAGKYDVEDAISIDFTLPGGARGSARWDFASEAHTDDLVIQGARDTLTLSVFGSAPLRLGSRAFDLPNPPHVQQPLIQTVVDALQGRGTCPSTGASAARTSRVMDQALWGYYGSRDPGFWLRPETWPGRR
jgi:1,5-anhydro-D-fructose reductase (1,5-anhydro-D-mannitol-forming)